MAENLIRTKLLEAGAKNLRDFGYHDVKGADIMASYLFRNFFEPMLKALPDTASREVIRERDSMLQEIESLNAIDRENEKKKPSKKGKKLA